MLVLDEPTAHLDPPAAEALIRDVVTAAAGRTVLLITHRPEGLEHMDEIVRLAMRPVGEPTAAHTIRGHARSAGATQT